MRTGWITCLLMLTVCACAPRVQTAASSAVCMQEGIASFYDPQPLHKRTADGQTQGGAELTAAHRSLPFGTQVLVTNLATGRSVVVRINDRGPVSRNRIIDLSAAAAKALDMRQDGLTRVRLELAHPTGEPAVTTIAAGATACPLPPTTES